MKVLVTGGAGFIGKHLCARLLLDGHSVTILDNFSPQIHGADGFERFPAPAGVTVLKGDVRNRAMWLRSLSGQDAVVHLAAETGTGQSMYEVSRYEAVNIGGTALMLDCIVNEKLKTIRKIVVASSRAVYGEGAYACSTHGIVYPQERAQDDLKSGRFEPRCPRCGAFVKLQPTPEDAPSKPSSFYGLTKQVQEQMVLMYAGVLNISAYALRYQNVYGPGQSLNNPYTGILAIFSNLAREHKPIEVFEDGTESRDFVYIDDVVAATTECLSPEQQGIHSINVGTGVAVRVMSVVEHVIRYFNSRSPVTVTGAFRQGDIRHNLADLSKARAILNFEPTWRFDAGVSAFLKWAERAEISTHRYEASLRELREKGLMHE